jgi:hypothetical protein
MTCQGHPHACLEACLRGSLRAARTYTWVYKLAARRDRSPEPPDTPSRTLARTFDEALAQGVARAGDPFADSGLPPDDAEVTGSPRAPAGMHGDFYVRAECGEEAHQAIGSELLQASADDV